jgi:RHS repeat-associated protein
MSSLAASLWGGAKYTDSSGQQQVWRVVPESWGASGIGTVAFGTLAGAGGERIIKATGNVDNIYENGQLISSNIVFNSIINYPNEFYVHNRSDNNITKHYYAGSQRIAARLITSAYATTFAPDQPQTTATSDNSEPAPLVSTKALQEDFMRYLEDPKTKVVFEEEKAAQVVDDEEDAEQRNVTTANQLYFFHPDHLGTATFLTNHLGIPYQFFLNLPFGETMAEQRSSSGNFNNRWKFNGKELDEETGLYYYGARFYNPSTSLWLSVDPLAEKTMDAYGYCYQNPIKFIDPTGEEPTPYEAALMAAHVYDGKVQLGGGWKVSSMDVGLRSRDYNNDRTGFKSALYERTIDGVTEYVYATAGTYTGSWKELKADAIANAGQALFGNSDQYDQSIDNAKIIAKNLGDKELTFTGHSLGGGLASANAIATDKNAYTFNAAGLSGATKQKASGSFWGRFKSFENLVTAYQLKTDPLTILQDATPLPDAAGKPVMLNPFNSEAIKNGHSIMSVISSFPAVEKVLTPVPTEN